MATVQTEYSSFEAKAHLSDILRQVEAGEQVTITRRGKPVAVIVSYSLAAREKYDLILERFREIRTRIQKQGKLDLKDLVNEGRKG